MIQFFQFPPAFGLPNGSPFCMKLETWLRMAGLPYENRYTGNVKAAPKGKMPYIKDGKETLADSGLIIDYLKAKYGDPLDKNLSKAALAKGHAIRRMIEESLYWPLAHSRWIDDAGWAMTKVEFFGAMPQPLRTIVPPIARAGIQEELKGQGMGRHSAADIQRLGCADIDALAGLLDDQPYFLGDSPSSVDATAYAFLANIINTPLDSPLAQHAKQHANLVAYCQRMKERYWKD